MQIKRNEIKSWNQTNWLANKKQRILEIYFQKFPHFIQTLISKLYYSISAFFFKKFLLFFLYIIYIYVHQTVKKTFMILLAFLTWNRYKSTVNSKFQSYQIKKAFCDLFKSKLQKWPFLYEKFLKFKACKKKNRSFCINSKW